MRPTIPFLPGSAVPDTPRYWACVRHPYARSLVPLAAATYADALVKDDVLAKKHAPHRVTLHDEFDPHSPIVYSFPVPDDKPRSKSRGPRSNRL